MQAFAFNIRRPQFQDPLVRRAFNLAFDFECKQSLTLDATDRLFNAAAYNQVIIAYRDGAPVRVSDIGVAVDGVEDIRQAAWLGHQRAVIIDVHKQPGFNINETVQLVKDALSDLQHNLPPSIKVQVMGDRTQTIRGAVSDVQMTMAISVALVVLVVFLFLRHVGVTLIPSVTIPVSLLVACAVMYVLGYTVDNVSLMALTISVGFIIDDGIVMVENIMRHVEAGVPPLEAALKGSREIGFTIVSMTLSLVAVFIPVLLMSGLIGRLFREFAVTAAVAILVSGVVSLTLTPMMCAQLLKAKDHARPDGRIVSALEAVFDWSLTAYGGTLRWSLQHRAVVTSVMLATLATTISMSPFQRGSFHNRTTAPSKAALRLHRTFHIPLWSSARMLWRMSSWPIPMFKQRITGLVPTPL
jgi:multidrug efflux pump subunit AcrB